MPKFDELFMRGEKMYCLDGSHADLKSISIEILENAGRAVVAVT